MLLDFVNARALFSSSVRARREYIQMPLFSKTFLVVGDGGTTDGEGVVQERGSHKIQKR